MPETTNDTDWITGPRRGPVCRINFYRFHLRDVDDLHALRGREKDALKRADQHNRYAQ